MLAEIDADTLAADSSLCNTLWVAGDLNLLAPDEFIWDPAWASGTVPPEPPRLRERQREWEATLGKLIEVVTDDHSHFIMESVRRSRIDRVLCSLPAWAVASVGFDLKL